MNIALLKRVKQAILKRPGQFEMNWFFQDVLSVDGSTPSHCGTAACIAGWAVHIAGGKAKLSTTASKHSSELVWDKAEKLLRIPYHTSKQLFEVAMWPQVFGQRYHNAVTPLQRAKVAAARISHFIKTKGAE